jgi:predicted nucleic acid-binding protein
MAIFLLDTSVVIDAISRKRGRWQLLKALVESGETPACSAITIMEIYTGLRPHESVTTQAFLDGLEHYRVDRNLGRYAGLLKNEWASKAERFPHRCRHCGDGASAQTRSDNRQPQGISQCPSWRCILCPEFR